MERGSPSSRSWADMVEEDEAAVRRIAESTFLQLPPLANVLRSSALDPTAEPGGCAADARKQYPTWLHTHPLRGLDEPELLMGQTRPRCVQDEPDLFGPSFVYGAVDDQSGPLSLDGPRLPGFESLEPMH